MPRRKSRKLLQSDDKKSEIFTDYVKSDQSLSVLANKHKVAYADLADLITRENWGLLRAEYARGKLESALADFQNFLAEEKVPSLRAQLRTVKKLHEKVDQYIDGIDMTDRKGSTYDLERMSRALKAIAEINEKLLTVPGAQKAAGAAAEAPPLFPSGAHPVAPAIDVPSREQMEQESSPDVLPAHAVSAESLSMGDAHPRTPP